MHDASLGTDDALIRALDNYERERHRLAGGHYPHLACNCAFCDTVRAADYLYHVARANSKQRARLMKSLAPPQRRMRN